MIKILPNPFVEKFKAEQIRTGRVTPTIKNFKPTREDIKKIVTSWFNKEAKHKVFHLDELIDALHSLIQRR